MDGGGVGHQGRIDSPDPEQQFMPVPPDHMLPRVREMDVQSSRLPLLKAAPIIILVLSRTYMGGDSTPERVLKSEYRLARSLMVTMSTSNWRQTKHAAWHDATDVTARSWDLSSRFWNRVSNVVFVVIEPLPPPHRRLLRPITQQLGPKSIRRRYCGYAVKPWGTGKLAEKLST